LDFLKYNATLILKEYVVVVMAVQPFVGPWLLTLWMGVILSQGCYLHTGKHKQNKRTQTSMPWVGFKPMTPVFKWVKTVHALDHATTVVGNTRIYRSHKSASSNGFI
jgi:hypothetical protein